jgi:hypothetical protein
VSYFNFVIFKLICIFAFIVFVAPKAQIYFLQSLLSFYPCHTLSLGSFDVIVMKESELFQFWDLKTNLHIRVYAFPWSINSNLFPPIFIEILFML